MEEGYINGKKVFITGACGTIGYELLAQALRLGAKSVMGIDNNESKVYELGFEYAQNSRVSVEFCDMRDPARLGNLMTGYDIVIHAAALKHVSICESSPLDAVQTNILGTQNVIEVSSQAKVQRVLLTSSDKAVNPTNVMGTSKLMGEQLFAAASVQQSSGPAPIFSSTRFGNVLGTNGSVLPIFKKQIAQGGPVTITDESMTRFVMSVQDAAKLVLDSVSIANPGDVLVAKMPIVRIHNLAQAMIEHLAPLHGYNTDQIELSYVGLRPGEKLYEELMTDTEIPRATDIGKYIRIRPNIMPDDYPTVKEKPMGTKSQEWNSHFGSALSVQEIQRYLLNNKLL